MSLTTPTSSTCTKVLVPDLCVRTTQGMNSVTSKKRNSFLVTNSKFKIGDKVRVLDTPDTIREWVGAEGVVIGNSGYLLEVTMTTEVKDPNNWKKVGDIARMYEDGLELVGPETKFAVGDIVEFWEEGNDKWQGGKAKVLEVPVTAKGLYLVEYIQGPPKNTLFCNRTDGTVSVFERCIREWKAPVEELVQACKYGLKGCSCSSQTQETAKEAEVDLINDPPHYGGKDDPF